MAGASGVGKAVIFALFGLRQRSSGGGPRLLGLPPFCLMPVTSSSASVPAAPNTLVMIGSAMLAAFVAIVLARLSYGLILPAMRADLGWSHQQAGQLGSVTALGYLLFVLPGGVLAARWGARRTVLGGLGLIALSFVGLALAQSWLWFACLMLVLGLGTAFCFAPMLSLVATWYPLKRGLMIGWMTTGIGGGLLVAGLVVPPLIQALGQTGWRAVWALYAAITALALALVWWGVRDAPGFVPGAPRSRRDSARKWRVYRNRRVVAVGLAYAVIGAVHIVQTLFVVSWVEESGLARTTAGRLVAVAGLLSVLCAPLWGWLSDRWGRGNTLLLSMGLVLLAVVLPLVGQVLLLFVLHYLLMGGGGQGAFTMIQAASTEQVAPRDIPLAVSYVTLFYAGGQFLGPALASPLIEWAGYAAAQYLCAALMLAGVGLAWRIRGFAASATA